MGCRSCSRPGSSAWRSCSPSASPVTPRWRPPPDRSYFVIMLTAVVLAFAISPGPLLSASPPPRPSPAPPRPRLVVVITVDQLRADYLVRWRSQLTGGFATLLAEGAVFTSAFQDHGVTETAPGHSTVLSARARHRAGSAARRCSTGYRPRTR